MSELFLTLLMFFKEIGPVAEVDMSADLPEEADASDRLEGIEGGLKAKRRQALTYLNGVEILESLVKLFQQGRLTSEDLSKLSALIAARRESVNGASPAVSDSRESSLNNFSLPPVRLTRFEAWCEEMKALDALATKHEGLLTSSRFIFSYPCVSVQAGSDSVHGSGSGKLRLSSVPIFDDLQSEDPISELFGKSPLNPESSYKSRLDTVTFRAGILVQDYRFADLEDLKGVSASPRKCIH